MTAVPPPAGDVALTVPPWAVTSSRTTARADAGPGDRAGPVATPQAVEDVRQFVGRDAGPGVGDFERGRSVLGVGSPGHPVTRTPPVTGSPSHPVGRSGWRSRAGWRRPAGGGRSPRRPPRRPSRRRRDQDSRGWTADSTPATPELTPNAGRVTSAARAGVPPDSASSDRKRSAAIRRRNPGRPLRQATGTASPVGPGRPRCPSLVRLRPSSPMITLSAGLYPVG